MARSHPQPETNTPVPSPSTSPWNCSSSSSFGSYSPFPSHVGHRDPLRTTPVGTPALHHCVTTGTKHQVTLTSWPGAIQLLLAEEQQRRFRLVCPHSLDPLPMAV